ncbi:inorganic polyphosphate kinase [Modestobacter caceresii]|uniref:NAD kinase n=1 Tax=Modestobacter caceresii TaxID=1522368 RepID=A0A098Y8S1_9ACTN|nr:NAD(+)/NADH kinase [Modestobacter caceresii]KGH46805.1 inorganic polyphosphate kinase [Modestobacter caceresii]
MVSVRRIGLVVHGGRPAARDVAERVRAWAGRRDVAVIDVDVWTDPGSGSMAEAFATMGAGIDDATGALDLVVTVGGDGTFLRGVRVAARHDAPVLGVDLGRVGFLTEVRPEEVERALDACVDGTAPVEPRLTLRMRASRPLSIPPEIEGLLRYGRGPALPPPVQRPGDPDDVGYGVPVDEVAVNDVVFEKLARDRQASLGVYLDAKLFASYSADALIVASSTGSTAYSFAAGGPVVSPRLDALVFTPVAPHMVFDRSLLLAADETVGVRVLERSGRVAVSVDGQLRGVLEPGDWVAVHAGATRARLVRLRPTDFYGRLRARFGLADAAAATADGTPPADYRPSDDVPMPDDIAQLFRDL